MYRVLYRKYRPKCFADVIGQPQVTDTLKNELKADRLAHAYLFTGSRGTGKTTCSKILSKAVNCLSPNDGDPCGECSVCRGIDDGSITDVVEIDAASNNGVDDIRILREEANFTPAEAKYRVYIIDEVHMLSISAFNALLKTLEEPPPHVIFILATTEVHKLPATITSRCQRFDFHRISPEDIAERLEYVCSRENVSVDHDAALLVAGIADGAMRDALSLLDQCMGQSEHITEETVRKTAGLADKSHLFEMTDSILNKDAANAVRIIDELHRNSKDMARLCDELIGHFRAIMLIKTVREPKNNIVMSESDFERASKQAEMMKLPFVIRVIDTLQSAMERMLQGVNRRIEMEMTAVKLCSRESTESSHANPYPSSDLEQRISVLEKFFEVIKNNPSILQQKPASKASSVIAPPITKPSVDMDELCKNAVKFQQWQEIIENIKKYSRSLGTSFDGSTAYISGKYVLVDSGNDLCFELLRKPEHRTELKNIIHKVTGKSYSLGRYSYPDEQKADDPLTKLLSDFRAAGVPVEDKKNNNNTNNGG